MRVPTQAQAPALQRPGEGAWGGGAAWCFGARWAGVGPVSPSRAESLKPHLKTAVTVVSASRGSQEGQRELVQAKCLMPRTESTVGGSCRRWCGPREVGHCCTCTQFASWVARTRGPRAPLPAEGAWRTHTVGLQPWLPRPPGARGTAAGGGRLAARAGPLVGWGREQGCAQLWWCGGCGRVSHSLSTLSGCGRGPSLHSSHTVDRTAVCWPSSGAGDSGKKANK